MHDKKVSTKNDMHKMKFQTILKDFDDTDF